MNQMDFSEAFTALIEGKKIKRPHWLGFWKWENGTVKMHCKDGKVLDIREMEDPLYTLQNIAAKDWEITDQNEIVRTVTFSFSDAIRFLKEGKKVARTGWNGKGMWLGIKRAFDLEKAAEQSHNNWMESKKAQGITSRISEFGEELMKPYSELSEQAKDLDRGQFSNLIEMTQDYIYMKTADNKFVPWLASQTDILSNDWELTH